jgi:hypothetical protein
MTAFAKAEDAALLALTAIVRERRILPHSLAGWFAVGICEKAWRCCPTYKLRRSSELVFGALTQNRSSLAAIAGTPRIENGGTFAGEFADGRLARRNIDVQPDAPQPLGVPLQLFTGLYVSCVRSTARHAGQWRQIQEAAQNYSGFGLKPQTPTPKSAQLASRAQSAKDASSQAKKCTIRRILIVLTLVRL